MLYETGSGVRYDDNDNGDSDDEDDDDNDDNDDNNDGDDEGDDSFGREDKAHALRLYKKVHSQMHRRPQYQEVSAYSHLAVSVGSA